MRGAVGLESFFNTSFITDRRNLCILVVGPEYLLYSLWVFSIINCKICPNILEGHLKVFLSPRWYVSSWSYLSTPDMYLFIILNIKNFIFFSCPVLWISNMSFLYFCGKNSISVSLCFLVYKLFKVLVSPYHFLSLNCQNY